MMMMLMMSTKALVTLAKKKNQKDVGTSLMAKLQKDVEADEELHKLDSKATKKPKNREERVP